MAGSDRPPHYHAFLLRCWQERSQFNDVPAVWRFSLENPQTGDRFGFTTLDAVIAALQDSLANDEDMPKPNN